MEDLRSTFAAKKWFKFVLLCCTDDEKQDSTLVSWAARRVACLTSGFDHSTHRARNIGHKSNYHKTTLLGPLEPDSVDGDLAKANRKFVGKVHNKHRLHSTAHPHFNLHPRRNWCSLPATWWQPKKAGPEGAWDELTCCPQLSSNLSAEQRECFASKDASRSHFLLHFMGQDEVHWVGRCRRSCGICICFSNTHESSCLIGKATGCGVGLHLCCSRINWLGKDDTWGRGEHFLGHHAIGASLSRFGGSRRCRQVDGSL